MPLSDGEPFKSLRPHEEYYLSGGDLFFLVEQCQFRVHRYFFERESKFFQSKLNPVSPGNTKQGTSENTAIFLDDVKTEDFARFLWVFYNPKYSLYDASVADWTAILALSHRWGFPEVKSLVVRELQKLEMDDIDRIVAYQEYDVNRLLLIPCYAALCKREEPLSLEEGLRLGMATTLNIVRARELARSSPSADGTRSPTPADIDGQEMGSIIRSLFGLAEQSGEPLRVDTTPASRKTSTPTKKPPTNGPKSPAPKTPTKATFGANKPSANGASSWASSWGFTTPTNGKPPVSKVTTDVTSTLDNTATSDANTDANADAKDASTEQKQTVEEPPANATEGASSTTDPEPAKPSLDDSGAGTATPTEDQAKDQVKDDGNDSDWTTQAFGVVGKKGKKKGGR